MSLKKILTFFLLLGIFAPFAHTQNYSVHRKNKSYFGLTGGINFSIPSVTDRYSVLSSAEQNVDKDYEKFGKTRGAQFGVQYSFHFTNSLSILAGVGYQTLGFRYFTAYAWADTVNMQEFNREMNHIQKVSYITVPLQVRWDMTKGQLKPFVQGGVFMDFRHQARKNIFYDNLIDQEVDKELASSSSLVSISNDIRKFNMGITGGVGLSYLTKYITLSLETNLRFGFYNVVNDQTRFADANGFALQYLDVPDQLKIGALNVQLSATIPISNSVKSNIFRKSKYYKKR